jgi:hypothetical protein
MYLQWQGEWVTVGGLFGYLLNPVAAQGCSHLMFGRVV